MLEGRFKRCRFIVSASPVGGDGGSSDDGSDNGSGDGLWHIKPDGEPGRCHAKQGRCPYGGVGDHYSSSRAARDAHERQISEAESGKRLTRPSNDMTGGRALSDAMLDRNPEELAKLDENGVDPGHAAEITRTAFSDDVLTNAPLASLPGVPPRLQPLQVDFEEAKATLPQWSNPGTVAYFQSKGVDLSKVAPTDVARPWQLTYMGRALDDGREVIPPEGDPRRQAFLDDITTEYSRRLYALEQKYDIMNKAFYKDYKGDHFTDYSCARMLAHWGRALDDEKAYMESLGGRSRFQKPEPEWLTARKKAAADAKAKWESEHPGENYVPPKPYRPPFSNRELDSDWTAQRVAKDALVMQGRSLGEARGMADRANAAAHKAYDDAIAAGKSENQAVAEKRDTLKREMQDFYFEAPIMDGPVTMIDIETTGLDTSHIHIQDVGWCTMSMTDPSESMSDINVELFGNGESREATGNPTTHITGITTKDIEGKIPFDKDPEAQERLLGVLTARPFVAHNAQYEDANFTAQVRGYAEAKRTGKIRIIDSMNVSKRLDYFEGKTSNSLEAYSKRWGVIAADQGERHRGLEDAQVMGIAMRRNLAAVKAKREGRAAPKFGGTFNTGRSMGVSYDAHGGERR